MVEQVRIVEQNEYDLIYFRQPYESYHTAVNERVSEEYWAARSDEIVFGHDDATYTRDDLAKMTQEEYDKHKEVMRNILRGMDMDKLQATVRISEVYAGNNANEANICTIEHKELKDQPYTATTKQYSLEKRSGQWLITKVEQDKYTYASGQTSAEQEEGIKALRYQVHEDKEIGYPTVAVLSGTSD